MVRHRCRQTKHCANHKGATFTEYKNKPKTHYRQNESNKNSEEHKRKQSQYKIINTDALQIEPTVKIDTKDTTRAKTTNRPQTDATLQNMQTKKVPNRKLKKQP